ncbi:hypothetical protein F2Q69_00029955 [Brassica cretica]|uniref:Uncharacterized protein n=1 Tax=Brassica cretica TaxID=69181 RepID=A0A8S9S052_BRACR|nr:hypothetical protein F2Q69_00029955 [Brassica cretica]
MKIEKNGISPFSSYDGLRVEEESSNRPWREYIRSSSCDPTRFSSLSLLELGNSPTALVAEAPTLFANIVSHNQRNNLNVDQQYNLNVDRRHYFNVDRRYNLNVDQQHDLNVHQRTLQTRSWRPLMDQAVILPQMEVTFVDFLELEEWFDSEQKLDDERNTTRKDLETSPRATIDRHQPDEIDRQLPQIFDQCLPYIIDRHPPDSIELHPPDCIDRQPWLDILPGYIVEQEQVKEMMYMSKASHLAVSKHQRPPIWTEEVAGFHKRVKRIHDPVKIVVPCAVFEAESPIPLDRSMQFSSYIEVMDDHHHVEASQGGLRFRDEVDKSPVEAASIDTDQIPSNDTNKPASISTITSTSIDTHRVSKQKEYEVCRNLFDGGTTTQSDKSGGKKRRNWKKRKRTKGGSQLSLIPHSLDGVRKSRMRSRCFSQPFAKLRALLIAEMIDKGEESKEEAFTQE